MFYGWRIVGGSFLSQAFVVGFFTYAVSFLTQPVQESFGVSVEMVMYSLTCGTFIGLFTMPLAGILLDRLSVRRVFAAGIVVFALGLWLLGQTTTIFQYIVIFGLMGPIITLFVMLGFPLAGRLYDVTGSFSLCLWIFSALMAVAATLLVPLRLPRES